MGRLKRFLGDGEGRSKRGECGNGTFWCERELVTTRLIVSSLPNNLALLHAIQKTSGFDFALVPDGRGSWARPRGAQPVRAVG